MGRLYTATCKTCGKTIRARQRDTLMSKLSKHIWKYHREAQIRRIRAGNHKKDQNPTVQDFIEALKDNAGRAFTIYKEFRKRDYMVLKRTMDALEPYLPTEIRVAWKTIEAISDRYEGKT